MKTEPPRLAEWLLTFFKREDFEEEVLGDFEEKFYASSDGKTLNRAKLNYWFQVINYLRPFAIKIQDYLIQLTTACTRII